MALRLVTADLLALLAFSVLGAWVHGAPVGLELLTRTFLPLALSWGLAACLLGTYRTDRRTALLATWLVAVPVGILLRQALVGRLASPGTWTFLLVGTATTGLLLALGRLVVRRFARPA